MSFQFATPGVQATGDAFHGRSREVAQLRSRVLERPDPMNIAIVGQPRIGKSSLLHHVFKEPYFFPDGSTNLAVFLDASIIAGPDDFFRSMVDTIMSELERVPRGASLPTSVKDLLSQLRDPSLDWESMQRPLQRLLRQLETMAEPVRAIVVIDEFDYAGTAFGNNMRAFLAGRNVMSRGDGRVSFVTASRRAIEEIVGTNFPGSDFGNVMQESVLGPYTNDEYDDYRQHIDKLIPGGVRESLLRGLAGQHPFFLNIFAVALQDARAAGEVDPVGVASNQTRVQTYRQFRLAVERLQQDGRLGDMLELLFGKTAAVTPMRQHRLVALGLIQPDGVHAFCDDFSGVLISHLRSELVPPELRNRSTQLAEVIGNAARSPAWSELLPVTLMEQLRDRHARESGLAGVPHTPSASAAMQFALLPELVELGAAILSDDHPAVGALRLQMPGVLGPLRLVAGPADDDVRRIVDECDRLTTAIEDRFGE